MSLQLLITELDALDDAGRAALRRRPTVDFTKVDGAVRSIIADVRNDGDDALRELTEEFDRVTLGNLRVSEDEWAAAAAMVDDAALDALNRAADNIERFHRAQTQPVRTSRSLH